MKLLVGSISSQSCQDTEVVVCYLWLPRMCVSLARQLKVVVRVLNFVRFDARGIDKKIFVEVGIEYYGNNIITKNTYK